MVAKKEGRLLLGTRKAAPPGTLKVAAIQTVVRTGKRDFHMINVVPLFQKKLKKFKGEIEHFLNGNMKRLWRWCVLYLNRC